MLAMGSFHMPAAPTAAPPQLIVPKPKNTLYITSTAELRNDIDAYMLGIDQCFTTLEQANARVEMLGRCNGRLRNPETQSTLIDAVNCKVLMWSREGSGVRFLAQCTRLMMTGDVPTKNIGPTSPGGWSKDDVGLYFAETQLDVAGHVWVVAIHDPDRGFENTSALTRESSQHERRSSISMTSSRVSEVRKSSGVRPSNRDPHKVGWVVDSVFVHSDAALARAKTIWNGRFLKTHGRCRKVRQHFGYGRYDFKSATASRSTVGWQTCDQIRVERLTVMKEEAFSNTILPSVIPLRLNVPYRLSHSALRKRDNRDVRRSEDQRSSILEEFDNIIKEAFVYEDLPLALKIRHEHNMKVASLDDQRVTVDPHGKRMKDTLRQSCEEIFHTVQRMAKNAKAKDAEKPTEESATILTTVDEEAEVGSAAAPAAAAQPEGADATGNGLEITRMEGTALPSVWRSAVTGTGGRVRRMGEIDVEHEKDLHAQHDRVSGDDSARLDSTVDGVVNQAGVVS